MEVEGTLPIPPCCGLDVAFTGRRAGALRRRWAAPCAYRRPPVRANAPYRSRTWVTTGHPPIGRPRTPTGRRSFTRVSAHIPDSPPDPPWPRPAIPAHQPHHRSQHTKSIQPEQRSSHRRASLTTHTTSFAARDLDLADRYRPHAGPSAPTGRFQHQTDLANMVLRWRPKPLSGVSLPEVWVTGTSTSAGSVRSLAASTGRPSRPTEVCFTRLGQGQFWWLSRMSAGARSEQAA